MFMFLGSSWSANSLCCVWADDSALFFTFLPFFQQRRDELKCSKATKTANGNSLPPTGKQSHQKKEQKQSRRKLSRCSRFRKLTK